MKEDFKEIYVLFQVLVDRLEVISKSLSEDYIVETLPQYRGKSIYSILQDVITDCDYDSLLISRLSSLFDIETTKKCSELNLSEKDYSHYLNSLCDD